MSANRGETTVESGRLTVFAVSVSVMCVVALVPLVAIAPFDRPSADDFPYSILTHAVLASSGGGLGELLDAAIQTSANAYQTWQGLFTSAFILSLQPGIFGSEWYQLGAYAMLACIVFSSLYLAYAAGRYLFGSKTRYWIPVGLLIATVLLQGMPQVNEAVYWFNGAANYTPCFCAAMVASGCCITALCVKGRLHVGAMITVASVLVFFAGGCNYMPAFVGIMAMFGFAVVGVRRRRFVLAVPLVFALAGFLINASSPGTAVRRAVFPDHPGVISTLVHSAWEALMNVHSFADLTLLTALLLCAPFVIAWAKSASLRFSASGLVLSAVLSFIALVGVNCVPFYGTGSFGFGRTYNTCYELFVVSAFVCWVYLISLIVQNRRSGNAVIRRFSRRLAGHPAFGVAFAVAGVALIVFWGGPAIEQEHSNAFIAARELVNGTASSYAREYDARESAFLSAGPGDKVTAAPLEHRSTILFFSDINGQYGDNWSESMAQYYGIGEVVLDDSHEDGEDSTL